MRRSLVLALSITFLLLAVPTSAQQVTSLSLSLQDSINLAMKQNIDYQIALLNLDNAKIGKEKALAATLLTGSTYDKLQAEFNYDKAERDFNSQKKQLIINVVDNYQSILRGIKEVSNKEKEVEVAKEQLDNTIKQVKAGSASNLDQLRSESQYEKAKLDLRKSEDSLAEKQDDFAELLNLQEGVTFKLTDEIAYEPYNISLGKAQEEALVHSDKLAEAQDNLKLAETNLDMVKAGDTAPLDLSKAENDLKIAELNVAKVEANVRSAYNTMMQANENVKLSQDSYDIEAENYDIIKKQRNAGLKTSLELKQAEVSLLQTELALMDAIHNYNLAVLSLKKLISAELFPAPPKEVKEEQSGETSEGK